jgi:uncharacterized protein YcbX
MENQKIDIGEVTDLWRFPVKSMGGEQLKELEISAHGVVGDRAYAMLDKQTGKVVSAKNSKLFPELLNCSAKFVSKPLQHGKIPAVIITLSNGDSVSSDDPAANDKLSEFFGRQVSLIQTAPADFTIDQFHPDIAGLDPSGNQNTTVAQKLGSALFNSVGLDSPVPAGSFLDVFPVSVITTSTMAKLKELSPQSLFDVQRFRMNIVVKTSENGFVENEWVNHVIAMEDSAQLAVAMLDPRCVMTTLAQPGLPQDLNVLKTIVAHNRVELPGMGKFPCAGVYAVVQKEGTVRIGQSVKL